MSGSCCRSHAGESAETCPLKAGREGLKPGNVTLLPRPAGQGRFAAGSPQGMNWGPGPFVWPICTVCLQLPFCGGAFDSIAGDASRYGSCRKIVCLYAVQFGCRQRLWAVALLFGARQSVLKTRERFDETSFCDRGVRAASV